MKEEYTVEKGIPLPEEKRTLPKSKYPWDEMTEVGDSFPISVKESYGAVQSGRYFGKKYEELYKTPFKVAVERNFETGEARIWRKE